MQQFTSALASVSAVAAEVTTIAIATAAAEVTTIAEVTVWTKQTAEPSCRVLQQPQPLFVAGVAGIAVAALVGAAGVAVAVVVAGVALVVVTVPW